MKVLKIENPLDGMIFSIYRELEDLKKEYPGFSRWYYTKVVPLLGTEKRKIFVVMDSSEIAAAMILKNDVEKKICTLRVKKQYQNQGIATRLIKLAFKELGTEKPVITVSGNRLEEFMPLLNYLGFSLYEKYKNHYVDGEIEYSFNGPIEIERAERPAFFCF